MSKTNRGECNFGSGYGFYRNSSGVFNWYATVDGLTEKGEAFTQIEAERLAGEACERLAEEAICLTWTVTDPAVKKGGAS